MQVTELKIPGVKLIEPKVFGDARGFFKESFHGKRYSELAGIELPFVQDNVSLSEKGVLRGLHAQNPTPQGKLVSVLQGEVFDVAVDIRKGSPAFGQWVGVTLNAENHKQLYVPPGCAHGFLVTSPSALFVYKCTDYYNPDGEFSILWNDPDIGITWPMDKPSLSAKDVAAKPLREIAEDRLVSFQN